MKKKIYRPVIYISLMLSIMTSLVFGFNVLGIEKAPDKSYITVQIESRDTLWSLSKEYMNETYYSIQEYISEVKSINNLNNDMILADNTIILPIVK